MPKHFSVPFKTNCDVFKTCQNLDVKKYIQNPILIVQMSILINKYYKHRPHSFFHQAKKICVRSQLASQPANVMGSQLYLSIYFFWKFVNIIFLKSQYIFLQPILQPIVNQLSTTQPQCHKLQKSYYQQ